MGMTLATHLPENTARFLGHELQSVLGISLDADFQINGVSGMGSGQSSESAAAACAISPTAI